MPPAQGNSSRPGVPTWGRGAANYVFGSPDPSTGFLGDASTGQNAVNFNDILQNLMPALQSGYSGGAAQRDLASGYTNQALGATGGIAGQSLSDVGNSAALGGQMPGLFGGAQQAIGQQSALNSQIPNLFGAAQNFAGNINQGEGAYNTALGGATQSMNNVMNPTLYNPLYQNAMNNQITPTINAQFASRGLGSSGAPIAAISQAGQNLSDQFAQRQFQEQQQAQGTIANIGQGLTQSGVEGAQLPGQIYNQFMSGINTSAQTPGNVFNQFMTALGQQQQNYGLAAQNQMAPLQALGLGSQQFWQGVNNPMQAGASMYNLSRQPLGNLETGVTGITGGISNPHIGPVGQILGK